MVELEKDIETEETMGKWMDRQTDDKWRANAQLEVNTRFSVPQRGTFVSVARVSY